MKLHDALVSFLNGENWEFSTNDDNTMLTLDFAGVNAKLRIYCIIREEHDQALFYTVCPFQVPEGQRPQIAELISRANSQVIIGNFELNYDSGEVRYKTSLEIPESAVSVEVLRPLLFTSAIMMDSFMPAVIAVLHGGKTPLDAMQLVEGSTV